MGVYGHPTTVPGWPEYLWNLRILCHSMASLDIPHQLFISDSIQSSAVFTALPAGILTPPSREAGDVQCQDIVPIII